MPKKKASTSRKNDNTESVINQFAALGKTEADSVFLSSFYPKSFLFPWNPDPLVDSNDYTRYDEMRTDGQIKVCLSLKKDIILGAGWTIKCDDEEIKEQVTKNLENIGFGGGIAQSLESSMCDILSAFDYGFSLTERIFAKPNQTDSGLWELKELKTRPPHTFRFELDEKGNVKNIIQESSKQPLNFSPNKFIHQVYQPEFGNPYGLSDLNAAHSLWKAKKFTLRMYLRYIERFAGPTVVGRLDGNASPEEFARFKTTLENIQNNTTIIMPQEAEIEFIQNSKDAGDSYIKLLNWLDIRIARALLIPDLMGVSGDQTAGGSLALGKEQFKVFLSTIRKEAMNLEKKIDSGIVKPLVMTNYGPDIECSFEFKPMSFEDEGSWLDKWTVAAQGKLFKPNEDEINHLRAKTGFPEGDVEEVSEPVPNISGSEIGKKDPKAKDPKNVDPEDQADKKDFTLHREKSTYEAKIDFTEITKTLNTSEKGLAPEIMSFRDKMAEDLLKQAKGINTKFKPKEISKLKVNFRKDLNTLVRRHFRALHKEGVSSARKELFPQAQKNFIDPSLDPSDAEQLVSGKAFKIVKDITEDVKKKVEIRVLAGIDVGATNAEIAALVAKDLKATGHVVNTLVRTMTTEVFNNARMSFYNTDPLARQLITGYEYSAIMDSRTSDVCSSLDGKTFDAESDAGYIANITPPLHFNCRSLLVPITRFEPFKKDKQIPLSKLQKRGGGLIQNILKFQHGDTIETSGKHELFGDAVMVTGVQGKRIRILSINITNISQDFPIVVGFKQGQEGEIKNKVTLQNKMAPNWFRAWPDGWLLNTGESLFVNLGASLPVEWTVEYQLEGGA